MEEGSSKEEGLKSVEGSRREEEPKSVVMFSTSSSGRNSYDCSSPEFEFWMMKNPSFPIPHLLSADELFVDGVLQPLHLLPHLSDVDQETISRPERKEELEHESEKDNKSINFSSEISSVPTISKRWTDIFKKGDKKIGSEEETEKKSGRDRKRNVGKSAELNINIWPFSRSRSAGNGRPKLSAIASAGRKTSSAPCSRSNSSGESKCKKMPASPARSGFYLVRGSPVWQIPHKNQSKQVRKYAGKADLRKKNDGVRVLNINVPMCIRYQRNLSCNEEERTGVNIAGKNCNSSSGNSHIFNLRTLFSNKKVY